jgi:sugar lactone lactonase YvrE
MRYFFLGLLLIVVACKRDNQEELKMTLAVKSFWPNSGKAGTIVTINGTGFAHLAKDNKVSFNGEEAKVADVNDTVLRVIAPEKGTSGKLTVSTGDKQSEAGVYTYQDLTMQGVSPLNGPAGTNISIHGGGFSSLSAPAKVMVNGKEAIITTVNDTLLIAAVPVGAGSGPVKVIVDGKEVTGPDFIFQNISKIKPLKGGRGTQVTITGEGFSTVAAENSISFNGKPGTVVSATATELVVTAPNEAATGPLSVTVNGQKTVGPVFTVVPPPVLQVVTPLSSPAGKDVTITGDYFSGEKDENEVSFNGIKAVIKSAGEKQLVVTVPAGAGAGNMKVWVNGQETGGPLFKEQNLGVIKLSPDNGLTGTVVTISGIGFSLNASDNLVTFNGVAATVLSATETELNVQAPASLSTGTVNVKVNTLDATGPLFRRAGVMTYLSGVFTAPVGLAVDMSGNLYTLDQNQIKKITPAGDISTFAGSASGVGGHLDGPVAKALFNDPRRIVIDKQGNLYVMDGDYQRTYIRKITPAGDVSTVVNIAERLPGGLGVDGNGTVYTSKEYQGVYKLEASGVLTRVNGGYLSVPQQMVIDNAGNIYYGGGDYYNPYIQKVTTESKYVLLCGNMYSGGYVDGPSTTARLGSPLGVAFDPAGGIVFIDDMNQSVRMVTPDGLVSTITGAGGTFLPFKSGFVDGTLSEAYFRNMNGICVDKEGNIYVMDAGNKAIRKIFLK